MIVGNGIIAKALCQINPKLRKEFLFFASGVSNSQESSLYQFQREKNLLHESLNVQKRTIVYFSTLSVFNITDKNSNYVEHKKNMEKLIQNQSNSYLIYRLPNVVGKLGNPNTMFNYFKEYLLQSKTIEIKDKAYRYIIDLDDVPQLVSYTSYLRNKVINVNSPALIKVSDLVRLMAENLKVDPKINEISGIETYNFELNNLIKEFWEYKYGPRYDPRFYIKKIIKKYI
jgi:nucleoside-diphosphate-sugar epimerase